MISASEKLTAVFARKVHPENHAAEALRLAASSPNPHLHDVALALHLGLTPKRSIAMADLADELAEHSPIAEAVLN